MTHPMRKDGTYEHYTAYLGEKGRLVVPAKLRRKLGLKKGERMGFTIDPDGILRVTTTLQRIQQAQRDFDELVKRSTKKKMKKTE